MDKFLENELAGFENENNKKMTKNTIENLYEEQTTKENILLLTIDKDLYEKLEKNIDAIDKHVETLLTPWNENTIVEPYTVLSKEDAIKEYEENKSDYPNADEYFMKHYCGHFGTNGEIVSTVNPNGLYYSHSIKNRGIKFEQLVNMIVNEEISFNYLVHNGKLYDKNKSNDLLPDCDVDSYFIVINCLD